MVSVTESSHNTESAVKQGELEIKETEAKSIDAVISPNLVTERTPYTPRADKVNVVVQDVKKKNRFEVRNQRGVVTGLVQTAGSNVERKGDGSYSPLDGGIFRRSGFAEELTDNNSKAGVGTQEKLNGTLKGVFDHAVHRWGEKQFLFTRSRTFSDGKLGEFVGRSLNEINSIAEALAHGLVDLGLVKERTYHDELYGPAQKLRPIAMMFPNREEFFFVDQAANKASLTIVPSYATLGPDATQSIMEQVQATVLICDVATLSRMACMENLKSSAWGLTHVILLDDSTEKTVTNEVPYLKEGSPEYEKLLMDIKQLDIQSFIPFSTVVKYGAKIANLDIGPYSNPQFSCDEDVTDLFDKLPMAQTYKDLLAKACKSELIAPKEDDVQTICYTSGTTGAPKGVLITHKSLTSTTIACCNCVFELKDMNIGWRYNSEDTTLSILPLAHIMERLLSQLNLILGIKLCMFSQKLENLAEEFGLAKPSIFCAVPRLLSRLYAGVVEKVQEKGFIASTLFNMGVSSKSKYAENSADVHHSFWDTILFNKMKNAMGGNLKLILSGAAPLGESVQYKLESVFQCTVLEGYGMTECMGAVCVRVRGDAKGTVGSVVSCCEIKMEAVPEMDLLKVDKDQKGEICIRGPSVSPGYFRRPDLKYELRDSEGWLRTGDIGQINRAYISIRDRRKALFKLAQGEYISPEKIEGFLEAQEGISQAFVTGCSHARFPVAIITPAPSMVEGWTKGIVNGDRKPDIIAEWKKAVEAQNTEINASLMQLITEKQKLFDMASFEIPSGIHIIPMPFEGEELLTPTLKLKRNKIRAMYADVITGMLPEQEH